MSIEEYCQTLFRNYPSVSGSSSAELSRVFRHLAETADIVAISISSWNPALDSDDSSRKIWMKLLEALI